MGELLAVVATALFSFANISIGRIYRGTTARGGHIRSIRPPAEDGANLAIERDWLDTASNRRRFCFGSWRNRDCLLLWRRR